jgi:hypothetical protein
VLAFRAAHDATGDRRYLARMRESFDWYPPPGPPAGPFQPHREVLELT